MEEEPETSSIRRTVAIPVAVLPQINKGGLDFEADCKCLVLLTRQNVYCCLICGKLLAGRAPGLPVAVHALLTDHTLYVHMKTLCYYLMPQNVMIDDPVSLLQVADITHAIKPAFENTDTYYTLTQQTATDWKSITYFPGFMSLAASCLLLAAVVHVLAHIPAVVDSCISHNTLSDKVTLSLSICTVIQRLWSRDLLRLQVSLHPVEHFIHNVKLPKQGLMVLLNRLHAEQKVGKRIYSRAFRGKVLTCKGKAQAKQIPFWTLSVTVPPTPLFGTGLKVPEISLLSLLSRFDGTENESGSKMIIKKLAPYLVIDLDRGDTHNPTVVSFPSKLDMGPFTSLQIKSEYVLAAAVSEDSDGWAVCVPRSEQWFRLNSSGAKPVSSELLFLDTNHVLVWKRFPL